MRHADRPRQQHRFAPPDELRTPCPRQANNTEFAEPPANQGAPDETRTNRYRLVL